jgi:hypothetical protein
MSMKLSKIKLSNPYVGSIQECLIKRTTLLLENDAFNSAIYLDPRFNYCGSKFMNEAQKARAQVFYNYVNNYNINMIILIL